MAKSVNYYYIGADRYALAHYELLSGQTIRLHSLKTERFNPDTPMTGFVSELNRNSEETTETVIHVISGRLVQTLSDRIDDDDVRRKLAFKTGTPDKAKLQQDLLEVYTQLGLGYIVPVGQAKRVVEEIKRTFSPLTEEYDIRIVPFVLGYHRLLGDNTVTFSMASSGKATFVDKAGFRRHARASVDGNFTLGD